MIGGCWGLIGGLSGRVNGIKAFFVNQKPKKKVLLKTSRKHDWSMRDTAIERGTLVIWVRLLD